MSDDAEFDADGTDGDDGKDSNLVKDLRKQLRDAKKQADDSAALIAEVNREKRAKTVAETLTLKGARPELAKFYTGEDASPDAVNAWITENADLFGVETLSPDDAADQAAAQLISGAVANAPARKIGSDEDILIALKTKSRKELVELGYLQP